MLYLLCVAKALFQKYLAKYCLQSIDPHPSVASNLAFFTGSDSVKGLYWVSHSIGLPPTYRCNRVLAACYRYLNFKIAMRRA
jgi:hypothetical protein